MGQAPPWMPHTTVLVLAASAVSSTATLRWHHHPNRNAFNGAGAVELPKPVGVGKRVVNIQACKHICAANEDCHCLVYAKNEHMCWQRARCNISLAIKDFTFDIYIKEGHGVSDYFFGDTEIDEDATTTTTIKTTTTMTTIGDIETGISSSCPTGYLRLPDNLVNVSMTVENVNYDWLNAFPELRKAFVDSLKQVIADEIGNKVMPECMNVALSPGSVDVVAMVSPFSKLTEEEESTLSEAANEFSSANVLAKGIRLEALHEALSATVFRVVGTTGVITGQVNVAKVAIKSSAFPPADEEISWLIWTIVLLVMVLIGGAAAAIVMLRYRTELQAILDKTFFKGYRGYRIQGMKEASEEELLNGGYTQAAKATTITFVDQNGKRQPLLFHKQPLGIVMSKSDPTTIQGFVQDSYAKEIGVRSGWQIIQVNDRWISPSSGVGEVRRLLDEQTRCLERHTPRTGTPTDLIVQFMDTEQQKRIFCFKSVPLGFVMAREDPTVVQNFLIGSYAKEKGVGIGWRITQINGDIVHAHTCKVGDVERLISAHAHGLDAWPLRLDFDIPQGGTKTIYFKEGPLGMAYFNRLPLTIEDFKMDSVAKEMGVQAGWVLTRVGDLDVRNEVSFEKVKRFLYEGIDQLPVREKSV